MKKLFFIGITFSLLGVDSMPEIKQEFAKEADKEIRPTIEQKVTIAENKLRLQHSKINVKLAQYASEE